MGDRSNIVIIDAGYSKNVETQRWERDPAKDGRIWLYGHWMGGSAIAHAKHGLASDRVGDTPYLARVIFSSMVKDSIDETTGFGVSTRMTDNEHPIIVIDPAGEGGPQVWLELDGAEGKLEVVAGPVTREQFLAIDAHNFDDLEREMRAIAAVV
jgi:hypothetical protein